MKLSTKIIVVLMIFLFITIQLPENVNASMNSSTTNQENLSLLDNVSMKETSEFWDQLGSNYGGYLPDIKNVSFREFIKNQDALSVKDWIRAVITYFGYEVILNGKLLGTLIILTLCSTILQGIQTAFESKTISKVADIVIMLVLLMLALHSFQLAATYVNETILQMRDFMLAILPLMLGLMASFGSITAITIFHPIIVTCMHLSVLLISKIIIPLFFLSALLQMVSTLNESFQVTKLAELMKNTGLALLGISLTVFLSVISVQGATSAIQDGVAMKTTKFVTGNFIPVVGKLFTDAADTILSASLLLRNAVGIVGVIILLAIVLFPAIKIMVISLIYKVTSAVLQPLGDGPILKCLDIMSKHILYLFAALLSVSLMFFLTIVLLVVASNITLMLR
ncbi:stage III sporulation protein AE [Paraliobacillus quinghaiensis]|uniref:Stage III sporulation protein AE n=1 Tax=Paraliobacillus quinghaiensis TaxID=470815 RepID=A0A917TXC2_9BACI|nr:stage III sporulation protein AE [Paraliobacillus quinghaiensis]GGM40223.1 stage III sporulation protein AE [Paraliobacillus quinghaiensis]